MNNWSCEEGRNKGKRRSRGATLQPATRDIRRATKPVVARAVGLVCMAVRDALEALVTDSATRLASRSKSCALNNDNSYRNCMTYSCR